ncbi:MAG: hypothetical protein M1819_003560 [Sarea resinae]|nr:MAG: hypothetical protein M1819_003560 [Sarea resinae]
MPPGFETPSSRRFIITDSGSSRPSNLVPSNHEQREKESAGRSNHASQFVPTPRFSASIRSPRVERPVPAPLASSPLPSRIRRAYNVGDQREAIESVSDDDCQEVPASPLSDFDDDGDRFGLPQPPHKRPRLFGSMAHHAEPIDDATNTPLQNASRRDLSTGVDIIRSPNSPARRSASTRPAPDVTTPRNPRRFLFAGPPPSSQGGPFAAPVSPALFRSTPSNLGDDAGTMETTVSEVFSPSRRGNRYVPGGLADQVRHWAIQASQPPNNELRDEAGIATDLLVEKVAVGRHLAIVQGQTRRGPQRVILPGSGDGALKKLGDSAAKNSRIKIEPPIWEIDLLGQKWVVGNGYRMWNPPD